MEDITTFSLGPGRFIPPPVSPLVGPNRPFKKIKRARVERMKTNVIDDIYADFETSSSGRRNQDSADLLSTSSFDIEKDSDILLMPVISLRINVSTPVSEVSKILTSSLKKVFRQFRNCVDNLLRHSDGRNCFMDRLQGDAWTLTKLVRHNLSQIYDSDGVSYCISEFDTLKPHMDKILKRMAKLVKSKEKARLNGRFIYQFGIDLLKNYIDTLIPFNEMDESD